MFLSLRTNMFRYSSTLRRFQNTWLKTPRILFSTSSGMNFDTAQKKLFSLSSPPEDQTKLRLYGLYKVATLGKNDTPKPSFLNIKDRFKWDMWTELASKYTKEQAEMEYIKLVEELIANDPVASSPSASSPSFVPPPSYAPVSQNPNSAKMYRLADIGNSFRVGPGLGSKQYQTLKTKIDENGIATITLARPEKANALNMAMWSELKDCFDTIESDGLVRCVILSGEGNIFCSGMDLSVFAEMQQIASRETCEGRKREGLGHLITFFQDIISAPERCKVPVIAAVHGKCIGGALDLITSCDMRYCTESAGFSVKEIDLAIVADIGSLQRLPHIVGDQRAREMSYTGREISASEAVQYGLVLNSFKTIDEMMLSVNEYAKAISSKSPLTIRGIKKTLVHSRDHSVQEGLDFVKSLNSSILYSEDILQAINALMKKETPKFNRT